MKYIFLVFSVFFICACTSQPQIPTDQTTWLPTVHREGPRPQTSDAPLNTNIAHQQESQNSPEKLQEELWEFMQWLEWMTTWPTKISVAWARAVFTPDPNASTAAGDERLHLHPSFDGSMHIALPDTSRTSLIETYGRGEAHPRNSTTAMLYWPRDEKELEIIKQIITAVYKTHTLSSL